METNRQFTNPIFLSKLIHSEGNDKSITIGIKKDEKELCSITGSTSFTIETLSEDSILENGLLASGFAFLFFNYTESENPTAKMRSFTMDADLGKSFQDILGKSLLVPDTNVILDRIFSNLDYLTGSKLTKSLKMKIPRLAVLELEKFPQSKKENGKDLARRKSWLGYGELLYLQQSGATPMRELNTETLLGFSNIKGTENVDSWIRREINEAKNIAKDPNVFLAGLLGSQGLKEKFENYVFVTSDLTNALSSVSENIDTIHISRITDWKKKLREGNLKQVARLIITLSVLYENILVEINSKKFKFEGMWDGKTISHYAAEEAYFTSLR